MEPIEKEEYHGFTIEVYQDEDPENPREWDNLGTMACFHNRYDLGDKDHGLSLEDARHIEHTRKDCVVLPLYLYDHSILRISTYSFIGRAHHAEWDSGRIGIIYVTNKDAAANWRKKRLTPDLREKTINQLKAEVETYDRYLSGSVYGYQIKDEDGEVQDSCWGFFGMDFVINEAKAAAEAIYQRSMIQFELPFMEQTKEGENHVELT